MRSSSEISLFSKQWIALKRSSLFINPDGTSDKLKPTPGCVLRLNDSSPMLQVSDCDEVTAVFIRECYILWFTQFLLGVKQRPHGKFAPSSSPGLGKTMGTNLVIKLADSDPLLRDRPILYQFSSDFFYLHSDKVIIVSRIQAVEIAAHPKTFYILDGHNADPVLSTCLTLFISSPRSNNFKDWYYHAQIIPSYFSVWSLSELRQCRELCYRAIDEATVDARYRKYGGIARYVFWKNGEPPSLEGVIAYSDAR